LSHPLLDEEARAARPLTRLWAAVRVTRSGDELVVAGDPLFMAKLGTSIVELPDRFMVLGLDGAPLLPTPGRRFYITTETFDPSHALLEM
jgi:hypothetical protein